MLECDSLRRIGLLLKYYSSSVIGDRLDHKTCSLLEEYIINNPHFADDYIHLITKHLDGDKNNKIFGEINKYLINKMGQKCDIQKCAKYGRNQRDRESGENIKTLNDKNMKSVIDFIDCIHCNLIHSFDDGMRINKMELFGDTKNEQKEEEIDDEGFDDKMNKMINIISIKRKNVQNIRGQRMSKNNKFMTSFNQTQKS